MLKLTPNQPMRAHSPAPGSPVGFAALVSRSLDVVLRGIGPCAELACGGRCRYCLLLAPAPEECSGNTHQREPACTWRKGSTRMQCWCLKAHASIMPGRWAEVPWVPTLRLHMQAGMRHNTAS